MNSTEVKSENPVAKRQFYRRDPLTSILTVIGVFFLSQLVAGLLISLYPSLKSWTSDEATAWLQDSVYAQFFYILVAESLAVWLILKLLERTKIARARIGLIKPRLKDIGRALAGYGVYFVLYVIIILVATRFSNLINVDQKQEIGFDGATGGSLAFVFLSLVVLPPIAEELMFRGFLFTSLRAKFRFRTAVIMTSILFGVAHLQFGSGAPLLWVAAIDTFTLSCVLCYLREKSGSLWPGIYLHALKNGIAFVALFHTRF